MGTNYYIKHKNNKEVHIGKKSAGWDFVFCGEKLASLEDAIGYLFKWQDRIFNEYGEKVTFNGLLCTIMRKNKSFPYSQEFPNYFFESDGYMFSYRQFS